VTRERNAVRVTLLPPRADTGLVLVRAWVERGQSEEGPDALRARIITADHADPAGERAVTVAGVDAVVAVVRDFLTALAGAG
jgi:hypothetical protein